MQFTVGLKLKGKTDHIAVDAEDALIAALKVKTEYPEAVITYVRQQNRRGDARHPSHALVDGTHVPKGGKGDLAVKFCRTAAGRIAKSAACSSLTTAFRSKAMARPESVMARPTTTRATGRLFGASQCGHVRARVLTGALHS